MPDYTRADKIQEILDGEQSKTDLPLDERNWSEEIGKAAQSPLAAAGVLERTLQSQIHPAAPRPLPRGRGGSLDEQTRAQFLTAGGGNQDTANFLATIHNWKVE